MVKLVPYCTGHSSMGAYHREWGFREFMHPPDVLKGKTRFNLPLREHPYDSEKEDKKLTILREFEQYASKESKIIFDMRNAPPEPINRDTQNS